MCCVGVALLSLSFCLSCFLACLLVPNWVLVAATITHLLLSPKMIIWVSLAIWTSPRLGLASCPASVASAR